MTQSFWREAIRREAERRAREESLQVWSQTPEEEPWFNYRWEHVRSVASLALALGSRYGADMEVVEAAAWLHDLAKNSDAVGEDHGSQSARLAVAFLAGTDFSVRKLPAVGDAIASHAGLFRETPLHNLEAAILWDADKLSKLGATYLVHNLCTQPAWARRLGYQATSGNILQEYRRWADLAERIAASVHMPLSKDLAQQRLRFLHSFVQQLLLEAGEGSGSK